MMLKAYFHDECPAIGAGWRRVVVEREGRVWVRLINPHTLTAATVRRTVWEKIGKETSSANRRELRKKGLQFIETVRTLGFAKDLEEEAKLAARVKGMETRLRRALKAL
jgi:hypothetical protein